MLIWLVAFLHLFFPSPLPPFPFLGSIGGFAFFFDLPFSEAFLLLRFFFFCTDVLLPVYATFFFFDFPSLF